LTIYGTGLRRGELLGLHWRDVSVSDPSGPTIAVRETCVRSGRDTPKSEASERTLEIFPRLAEELWQHRRRSPFQGDDERVFVSSTGNALDVQRYAKTFAAALHRAGISKPVRPFHDGRHTAIPNDAAAGNSPLGVMKRAGHSSFKRTQGYIDLAGVTFRSEVSRLEERLYGASEGTFSDDSSTNERYKVPESFSSETTAVPRK
jgi:integrase